MRTIRPGTPTTVACGGTSFNTTAPRADLRAFADDEPAENLRARGNGDVFHQRGMALAVFLAVAPQSRALIDDGAGVHFGGFADDDAAAVVDEYAGINFRGGMDFYARKNFGALTDDAGEQFEVNPIKKIGESVVR